MSAGLRTLLALTLACLACLTPLTGRADSLTTVQTGVLPTLPMSNDVQPAAGAAPRVLAVGGRTLALTDDAGWLLALDRKTWSPLTVPRIAAIAAEAASGPDTLILLDAGGLAEHGARLTLAAGKLDLDPLPPLPSPLRFAHAAVLGDVLYVAGLDAAGAPRWFSLPARTSTAAWTALPAWQAPAGGAVSSVAAQNSALFVTVRGAEGKDDRLLRWQLKTGWREQKAPMGRVLDGAARATGQAHILYMTRAGQTGAAPQLLSYQTITGSWATQGDARALGTSAATMTAAGWGNGMLWPRPAAGGGTDFAFAEVAGATRLLKPLDWFIIVVYLAGMLGIGLYCYIREKRNSTADFFVGGRSIPFWAAGVSLYAANTSSISYIAIPAKAFETNWQYMTNNLIAVIALTFVAVWIVPLLRRLDLMSVFHYLEIRFHRTIRTLASLICIVVQIGSRMSVILLLPSLAIATITGIDVGWSIVIMGGFTIVYTAMGGMKAVVWTDFVQLFVKMGGALFAIGFIIYKLDGGVAEFFATSLVDHKMALLDFSWDLTKPTVWGFVFLVIFDVVLTFPKDQVLMQRVLSTKSAKEATRSMWTFAAISIPGGVIFYTIGTALFAFYKSHPERMNPLLTVDATFPLFIAAELPTGVTGLIIAGILAAAMATLSGIMNSVATLASVDFYEKFVKHPTPKKSVLFAECATVMTGLVGIAAALLLSRFNAHSLFDVSIELAGLLGGGFAGAYTLGMFTRRANWQGVAIGIAAAIGLTTFAWTLNLVHPYFYLPISIMLCIAIGYVASYLFPAPTQSLAGLTIYSD